ncbi:MAG: SOS response-associated peptidase [Acidimicrobiia bacterium]|nr:SOS response-associated peptidase [Acidimicrobiia bacterium]
MCGRFVQAQSAQSYAAHFGAVVSLDEQVKPSWNVAPTDRVYAVAEHDGSRLLGAFRWGLIPWFAKDAKIGSRHINARAETAATAASFKDSFARKRCLIPADGFYEWEKFASGGKLPHFIHHGDGTPLALAGLWSSWKAPDGERVTSCTIITTRPNELVGPIHDRMPVVLPRESWDRWLSREVVDPTELTPLLAPAADGTLIEHPVSTLVNDVKNNYAECIAPLR